MVILDLRNLLMYGFTGKIREKKLKKGDGKKKLWNNNNV